VVILHHIGGLQVLVLDAVTPLNERQRCRVMKILPLATHLLMRFR
jgi:hypothetical protein